MTTTPAPRTDDRLSDDDRIAQIAQLLVRGAIAAVCGSDEPKDRGRNGHAADEPKRRPKARSP